jgi:DNA-binding transcriptional ArsR family regulator
MVQYSRTRFDASFAALSDATRRGVLEQLGRADASITDLADKFHITLTGMKKHVGVLEQAGLVTTAKVGRVRTCRLGLRRLDEEAAWISRNDEDIQSRSTAGTRGSGSRPRTNFRVQSSESSKAGTTDGTSR